MRHPGPAFHEVEGTDLLCLRAALVALAAAIIFPALRGGWPMFSGERRGLYRQDRERRAGGTHLPAAAMDPIESETFVFGT